MQRVSRLAIVSWLVTAATMFALPVFGEREARAASCNTPADVSGGTPICHLFVCAPCATDRGSGGAFDCTDPNQPIYQQGGAIGGACTQCAPGKTSLCDADHPVCLSDGTCGCA